MGKFIIKYKILKPYDFTLLQECWASMQIEKSKKIQNQMDFFYFAEDRGVIKIKSVMERGNNDLKW